MTPVTLISGYAACSSAPEEKVPQAMFQRRILDAVNWEQSHETCDGLQRTGAIVGLQPSRLICDLGMSTNKDVAACGSQTVMEATAQANRQAIRQANMRAIMQVTT